MKNTFKNILTAVAAIALSIPAFAQVQDWRAIKTNKTATYDAANDKVDITLETFVNGYKSNIWTPKTDDTQVPLDIVLVLDVSGSMDDKITNTKKIDALKKACKSFIDSVAIKSTPDCVHRISIVKFAGDMKKNKGEIGNDTYESRYLLFFTQTSNYTQRVTNHLPASNGNLKTAIDNLKPNGATRADYGMELAKSVLDTIKRESSKLVVMFTDGKPTESSDFSTSVANNAISTSKSLKDSGITVYTVGVFDEIDDNLHMYMSAVSSDKPEATKYTEGNKGTGKYYMTASNANELEHVFVTIAGEEAQNTGTGDSKGAGVNLGGEDTSVTLKDIVTTNFVIPQTNGVPTDITLTLIPVDSVKVKSGATRNAETHAPAYSDYEIIWATDPSKFETITPAEGQVTVDGNTLNVDGKIFDFSANWIGVEEKWTVGRTSPDEVSTRRGKKLVISFSVKPDPTQNGGKVYTNTDESGVYVGDENVTPQNRADYEVPKPVFVPANITIRKSGMLPGESAIFEVTATGTDYSKTYTVAMTANEAGEMKDAVIMRVPIVTNPNAEANGEDLDWISYTVKETSWSWAYTSDQPSITRTMTNDPATHLFEFKNTPKSETPKHGEGNANNIFAK